MCVFGNHTDTGGPHLLPLTTPFTTCLGVTSSGHFRLVFLPNVDDLAEAIGRIARFLEHYRKRHSH